MGNVTVVSTTRTETPRSAARAVGATPHAVSASGDKVALIEVDDVGVRGPKGASGDKSLVETLPSPPADPQPGAMWWNASNGNTYIWYEDADSSQWVQNNHGEAGAGFSYDVQRSNTLWNPAIQAEAGGDYLGYPPNEEPDRYFNVVIAPGFKGFDNGIDIVRSTFAGNAVGEMLRGCTFTEAYGADALKWAKWSQRNTLIGSLACPWMGQDLTTDTTRNPDYPTVQRYYEHDTLNDNGTLWTDPAWDPFGQKIRSPGIIAKITDWVNSNPWADYKSGSDKSLYVISNVVVGRDALNQMVIGSRNVAVGYRAVCLLLDGDYNTGIGFEAGYMNTFASGNTSVGAFANQHNQDGGYNAALGYKTGNGVIHGGSNVYIGTSAGAVGADPDATVDVTMNRSVFIGAFAGYGITSMTIDDKLYVGNSASRGPLIAGDFSASTVAIGAIPASPTMDWKMRAATTLTVYSGASGATTLSGGADDLVIEQNGAGGMTIVTPNNVIGAIHFADPEANFAGYVQYSHGGEYMRFGVNTTERMRLTSTGMGFNGAAAITKPTVTGAKGANAALTSLLTALASYGLITDTTTA